MRLQDREEAGRELAAKLGIYREAPTGLILALPRGGVTVGYALSLALHLPLDVFIVRKIGSPENPEYALAAVSETGNMYLNPEVVGEFQLPDGEIEELVKAEQVEIARRQRLYRQGRPLPTLKDRTVILVDDGIATGATFFASLEAIRQQAPRSLVAAVPVGPVETMERIKAVVDEVAVLATPEPFWSVGSHYARFPQVTDDEVLAYLESAEAAYPARYES